MDAWMERKNTYYRDSLTELAPKDLLPGVTRFLTQAREAGILIGLASASKNARDVLIALDLVDLFNAVGDGHSVVNPKPAPDLFVWVAGRLGISPPQAVVFEDAEAGIEAALRGGFLAVGIGSANVAKAHLVITNLDSVSPTVVVARLKSGQGQTRLA
jgi:HAD superfamily hydrolase (TIGR01509 family)